MNSLGVTERFSLPGPISPPICNNVTLIDDNILEQVDTKSFHLSLSHPDRAVLFSPPLTAEVTITDDDCKQSRHAQSGGFMAMECLVL